MTDLGIIVPSRGRPERLRELLDAIEANSTSETIVYVATDYDDPALEAYVDMIKDHDAAVYHVSGPRKSLSQWTNILAGRAIAGCEYVASLGDDHRPRTHGWDEQLIKAIEKLDGPGFAYGNDLLQGAWLPTAWVVSSVVVDALGWMMLPTCEHMYVDNVIKTLGEATGRLIYQPSVVIEHEHPSAGKAKWDESYAETNRAPQYERDHDAFQAWRAGQMFKDAATLSAMTYDN